MDAKPKVVYLVTPGGRTLSGGIARMVDYTVRAWPAESPFVIHVVDSFGPGPHWLKPIYFAAAILRILWGLMTSSISLFHVNMSERLSVWRKLTVVALADAAGVPVILHLHGAEFAVYVRSLGRVRRNLVVFFMRKCAAVLVLGAYWRDFLVDELGLDAARVRIFHNAVPEDGRVPVRSEEGGRILFLGVVGERKGVDVLVRALARPELEPRAWSAVIAGNGEVDRFKALASELAIAGRVRFPGLLDEAHAREEMRAADIVVLPSRNEGLPMVILEAMSYGAAVVATPVGSIGDAIVHDETGLIVPVGNVEALAQALAALLADPALAKRLGENARKLFLARFSIRSYVEALEVLYGQVAGGKQSLRDEVV